MSREVFRIAQVALSNAAFGNFMGQTVSTGVRFEPFTPTLKTAGLTCVKCYAQIAAHQRTVRRDPRLSVSILDTVQLLL